MSGLQFTGRWIGETVGCESAAHIWEVTQRGQRLDIQTRWEGETQVTSMSARLRPDGKSFTINTSRRKFNGPLIDAQHFVIWEWDTNDIRGYEGPHFDVIFARPGIAELTARAAYERALAAREDEGVSG